MQTVTLNHPAYPFLLKEIHKPPSPLYIRGNLDALASHHLLAVVGSRQTNAYGQQCVNTLLPDLIDHDICIVSGLAYGIDAAAHTACINKHRPTIAVLGTGVDDESLYPHKHVGLAHDILSSGGVLLSEYPAGTHALPYHFPARNRIIAGMTKATIIIQAAVKSGSLITARLALEYNRDVYAVPGPIDDPLSEGTNQLIAEGAQPLLHAQQLLDAMRPSSINTAL